MEYMSVPAIRENVYKRIAPGKKMVRSDDLKAINRYLQARSADRIEPDASSGPQPST
jgi:hypothetical protein